VKKAALDRPRTETVNVDAFLYGYGAILMPRQRPVYGMCFIEEYRSYRLTCIA